jgi:hypothetical protein
MTFRIEDYTRSAARVRLDDLDPAEFAARPRGLPAPAGAA